MPPNNHNNSSIPPVRESLPGQSGSIGQALEQPVATQPVNQGTNFNPPQQPAQIYQPKQGGETAKIVSLVIASIFIFFGLGILILGFIGGFIEEIENQPASKYGFSTLTMPTEEQIDKLHDAVDAATKPEEVETLTTPALIEYYNTVDYTEQYGEGDRYADICTTKECIEESVANAGQTGKMILKPSTNLEEVKLAAHAIIDSITAVPIELLLTFTPYTFSIVQHPIVIKDGSSANYDESGATAGYFGAQYIFIASGMTDSRENMRYTIDHELFHSFHRIQLATFGDSEEGFDVDWAKIETREYDPSVLQKEGLTTYSNGIQPKDGYVSGYAQSSAKEDQAETYTYITNEIWAQNKQIEDISDTTVQKKGQLILDYIHRFVPKFQKSP